MTDNEKKLINLIRDHKHPEEALITAIETILDYLKQLQSSATPILVDSQEHV